MASAKLEEAEIEGRPRPTEPAGRPSRSQAGEAQAEQELHVLETPMWGV